MFSYKRILILFLVVLTFISAYISSYFLLSYYTGGDQYYYRQFYDALVDSDIRELFFLLSSRLGASEPVSGILLWLGANMGLSKDVYISFLNAFLLTGILMLCVRYKVNFVFIFLLFTNYYIVVLFTSAERLKIAFLFMVYALYFSEVKRKVFMILSLFSHFQMIVVIASIVFDKFLGISVRILFRNLVSKKDMFFLFLVFGLLGVVGNFSGSVFNKVLGYSQFSNGVYELFQVMALCFVAFLVLRDRGIYFIYMIPISIACMVVGSSRLNILAFFILLFFSIVQKRTHHPVLILLMVYFSFKSIFFIEKVFLYGNGFYNN
uniref:EpsG family protein n=1 Tax=Marinomonas sp. (strain MWYL1) TaxID=400668 RepID=A6VTF8_MARMS